MISLQSSLENTEMHVTDAKSYLSTYDFTIGGNWEYKHGCFDHSLDGANKVWLRIPFEVTQGTLDRENEDLETMIRIGTPFVLKHVYQEGLDPDADNMAAGGLLSQFQDPVDQDADVEQKWVEKGSILLRQIEGNLNSLKNYRN